MYPLEELPEEVKLEGITPIYVASPYFTVSEQLLDLIQHSSNLEHELEEDRCSIALVQQLCFQDRRFGETIFDDTGMLSSTVRKLKGPDASKLYDAKIEVDAEAWVTKNPEDVMTNAFGTTLLRLISHAFEDRLYIIEKMFCFLKIVFALLKGNEKLLVQHRAELMKLIAQLQDDMESFSQQLPVTPPKVGDFGQQLTTLNEFKDEVKDFLDEEVNVALQLLGKRPHSDLAMTDDDKSVRTPKRQVPSPTAGLPVAPASTLQSKTHDDAPLSK